MATNYEMWSPRRLPHNERALVATIYHAWAAGRPLTRGAAFAGLLKQGATAAAAASVLEAIAGPPRRSGGARESSVGEGATGRYAVVRDLNLSLVPRVIAALALVDDDLVRRDLDELGRLVSYLNQSYVGRLRGLSTSDVARTLDLDRSYVDRLVELGEFKRRDGGIEVGDEVLDWTTYDEFLRSRVPFATIKSAPKEPVVPSAVLQVRWQGLGPFRTATTLDLDPMTVLVGANGAGKTTSLMALSLLKAIAAGGLSSLRAFVPRVSEGTDEMMIATVVELQRSKTVSTETIDWQLVAGVAGRVRASSERLRRIRPIDHETELSAFEFGQGRWIAHDGAFVEHTMQVDELALTTSGSPGQLASLRQIMLGWRIDAAGCVPRTGDVDSQRTELWLAYQESPDAFAVLRDSARMVSGIKDLELRGQQLLISDASGIQVEASLASAGTLRAIEILAWLFAPQPPPLLAIDELENHLHGDLAARLLDVMRSVSQRTRIVVTTHSARVLRCFQPSEVRVVRRDARGSSIVAVEDDPHLRRLAAAGDLGDLIQDGYFAGGV